MARLVSETDRRAALQNAGLSDQVLRLALGEAASVHEAFASWCETPWYGYFASRNGGIPQTIPWGAADDTILPLWGYGETMTVCRIKKDGTRDFADLNIEDSSHELPTLAQTEQGLLADLMITVIESLDWESSEAWDGDARETIEAAARSVGFDRLTETFAFLDAVPASDYEEHKRAFTRAL